MHNIRLILMTELVPRLQEDGFRGSFPHFRRTRQGRTELLTFQFDRRGSGQFVIELAVAPQGPFTTPLGEQIPEARLTAHHLPKRYRLGAPPGGDRWFSFEKGAETTIKTILELLRSQGNEYFERGGQNSG